MRIQATAPDRKTLVKALAGHMGEEAVYCGPPSFAYTIGEVTVDREGEVILPDDLDGAGIQQFLESKGWLAPVDRLTISVPMEGLTAKTMHNLLLMLYSKQYLLGKAIRAETIQISDSAIERLQQPLPESPEDFKALVDDLIAQGHITGVDFTLDSVSLSFPLTDREDMVHAFTLLTVNILEAAKAATRVQAQRQEPENEKYFMRGWLVRLGFGGKEAKGMRELFLKHLKGNSAFLTEADADKHRAKYAAIRRSQKDSESSEVADEEG